MSAWRNVLLLGLITSAALIAAPSCESLSSVPIADVKITAATPIKPAPEWSPGGPGAGRRSGVKNPFCRIQGVIEKEIEFELWLPVPDKWNGKYLGAGVGGAAGTFNYSDLPRGLARGYAAATTDTGHKANDANWILGDPARSANFEHRANHLLAVDVKKIITAYYGNPAGRSYFIGCSGGGRQALKEMQLYPDDYDGIIAGAPGPHTVEMSTRRMWELLLHKDSGGIMTETDWQMVAEAGSKACDMRDRVIDGVAEDPSSCRFDPAALLCKGIGKKGCLTAAQLKLVRTIYAPMHDENGKSIDPGLLPGVRVTPGPVSQLALNIFGGAVHHDAQWDWHGFRITDDLPAARRAMPELSADAPDVKAFRDRNGKIIMYQGWLDPAVEAQVTVDYYRDVVRIMGGKRATEKFFRLFMEPGMYHCSGGPGPDQFGGSGSDAPVVDPEHDMLSALERWVEKGRAPNQIIASKLQDGKVVRTRPLCPFPETAHYKGQGSTDDQANFVCRRP